MSELFPKLPRCALCEREASDVATALVRYAEPDADNNVFGRLPRCRDHEACRRRVELAGEPWILDEKRSAQPTQSPGGGTP